MKNILRRLLILSLSAVAIFALAPTSLMADKPDSPPGKPEITPPESPPGNPDHTPPGLNKSILKQTGQTESYYGNGDVVADGSVKDDGYYQTGITPFYKRDNESETVRDHITRLIWQDDEDAIIIVKSWVTSENYAEGNYFDTYGDTAYTYCNELLLDGHDDWRLPIREELVGLNDYSRVAIMTPSIASEFQYVDPYQPYWSSTSYVGLENKYAWYVHFGYGHQANHMKNFGNNMRCVRGEQTLASNFTRNDDTGVITDSQTHLQWQDNEVSSLMDWETAIGHCESLSLGEHSDWRLPNINELRSLVDDTKSAPSIDNTVFQNTASLRYWSSTTYTGYSSHAWYINFVGGVQDNYSKEDNLNYVRCVRGGQ